MEFDFVVLGLGSSGVSAMHLLQVWGASVVGVDRADVISKFRNDQQKGDFFCEDEFVFPLACKTLVKSPGISNDHKLVKEARRRRIKIISEAELALRSMTCPVLAITGTNGKTTTTALVVHVLNSCGIKAYAIGNIGEPVSEYILKGYCGVAVVELSSYQLEGMYSKTIDRAVILNIEDDHLDRYKGSIKAYAEAKLNIFRNIKDGGELYINADIYDKYDISFNAKKFFADELNFTCDHIFTENLAAAYCLCSSMGVAKKDYILALKSFSGLNHRLEYVKQVRGIDFYNDSKGTNPAAVINAVNRLESNIILLAGGVNKGLSFESWQKAFKGKVKTVILFGQASQKIKEDLNGSCNILEAEDLRRGIDLAYSQADAGDKILLSPGCASFDMFRDYKHRGNVFKEYVQIIKEE